MENLGFSLPKALLVSSLGGTEYLVAAIVAVFLIDRAGRRGLMFWSAGAQRSVPLASTVIRG